VSIARTDSSNEGVRSVPAAGRDLVLAHHGGDPDAFDDIVRRYYPPLLAHARRRLFDDRLAEDAVQEAFLKAYRALPGFAGEYQLSGWLHRILSNVCNDEGARRSRETRANERWAALVEPENAGPEEYGEREEVRARVAAAVNELPANYREALVLRDVMDYEYADVAVAAGISEDNARARVSRARAALRRLVEGSVALGGAFVGGFKRAGRWIPKLSYHLSNSAGVTDAAVASTRTGPVIALATTSVAAMAVAVPLFAASSTPKPQAKPPATIVVSQEPTTGVTAASAQTSTAPAAAGMPVTVAPTSTRPSTTTTSTAVSRATTPVAFLPVPPGGKSIPVLLESTDVVTDTGGGMTEEPGQLLAGGFSPITGNLTTQLDLPPSAASACDGSLGVKFVWSRGPNDKSPHEVRVTLAVTGAEVTGGATTFDVAGTASVVGGFGTMTDQASVAGTVLVPSDGSNGTLHLRFSSGQVGSTGCSAADTATSVAPTTVAPTTTTAQTRTSAGPTTTVAPTSTTASPVATLTTSLLGTATTDPVGTSHR
jgi:RNA polymerase sigma-70 factor (ECF subfamily)